MSFCVSIVYLNDSETFSEYYYEQRNVIYLVKCDLGKIPKSEFLLTPREITQILQVIDKVPKKKV